MNTVKKMRLNEFQSTLKAQGVPKDHMALKCPLCKTVQSATDLIEAGAGENFEAVEKYLGFSCVGRFTGAGSVWVGTAKEAKKRPPGSGCDWTLGGFLQLHDLEVITEDGKIHSIFEPATPEEALAHMAAQAEQEIKDA